MTVAFDVQDSRVVVLVDDEPTTVVEVHEDETGNVRLLVFGDHPVEHGPLARAGLPTE